MGEVGDQAISNKKRDYPAWGYLLFAGVLGTAGAWFVAAGTLDDSRRPYLPWFMLVMSLAALGYGVREWGRNGSLSARRVKSADEQERDERSSQRFLRWQNAKIAVAAVLLVVVLVLALFT